MKSENYISELLSEFDWSSETARTTARFLIDAIRSEPADKNKLVMFLSCMFCSNCGDEEPDYVVCQCTNEE